MNCKRTYLLTSFIFLSFATITAGMLLNGCKGNGDHARTITGDTIVDGRNLAQVHCAKCHAPVPVNMLTKDVWRFHTLPSMSHYLGVSSYMDGYFKKETDTTGLNIVEWQSIVAYYKKMAPDSLEAAKPSVKADSSWAGFKLKMPAPINGTAFTTMTAINPYNHKIYTADAVLQDVIEWDDNLKMVKSVKVPSPVVSAEFIKNADGSNTDFFSCIGPLLPTDFANGKVVKVDFDAKKENQTIFAVDLARPVQSISADFNNDGLSDWVICGQGYLKGGVYLLKQNKNNTYTRQSITDQPGAVQAVAGDFNKDGWQDVMVLFGSGNEGLWLFLNDHKGGFTSKNLLHFPPVYGSTSFQLADIDHDGNPDLVYTCGYNYRDSRILKPYHGLYIFKNTGNWNFKQQWFYPINGCTKAIAADFDGDGDLDIATSAFFADMKNNPAEGFIYFEQDKPFSFKPHAIPISKYGRWMSMDVGDYNNDGKPDIVLGNYSSGFMFQQGLVPFWAKNSPFIVLENNFKK
jgi:hypothetical protein